MRPVLALSAVLPELASLAEGAAPAARDTAAPVALLVAEPAVHLVSIGLADGTLRQVARADALSPGMAPSVPPGWAFALREVLPGATHDAWTFIDAAQRARGTAERVARSGDLRQSQWYLLAQGAEVHVSTLYDLPLLGRTGLSVSRRNPGGEAVFALDITLDRLAGFLGRLHASPGSTLFLFTEDGILLAHQQAELATVKLPGGGSSWTTLAASGDPLLTPIGDEHAMGRLRPGRVAELSGAQGTLLVRLAEVAGMMAPA